MELPTKRGPAVEIVEALVMTPRISKVVALI
jgi:hypothetical protein